MRDAGDAFAGLAPVATALGKHDWTIRAAHRRDWRPVRMLLPRSVHFGCGCAVLVATEPGGRVVGAAALSPRTRTDPVAGSLCDVHVVPPWRRRGIGRALIEQFARLVRSRSGQALYAWEPVRADGDHATAWRALGFDQASSLHRTWLDVASVLAQLEPYEQRLRQRNSIPKDAAVVPLGEADAMRVAAMNVAHLGGTMPDLLRRLRGETPDAYDPNLSLVVTRGDEVLGCALVRVVEPGVGLIEANTIDPSHRGTWANVLLRVHGARVAMEHGLKTVLFDTRDPHADTRRVAENLGGETVKMMEPYRLVSAVKTPKTTKPATSPPFHG